jgi:Ca2+-transporting ATPase
MERKPLKKEQSIIWLKMITNIIILSSIMTIWWIFLFFKYHDLDLDMARSWVFILLVFIELIKIQIIRSQYWLWLFSNKRLIVAVNISIALVLAIIYIPVLSSLFKVKPVSLEIWMDIRIVIWILLIIGGILGKVLGRERKILNV